MQRDWLAEAVEARGRAEERERRKRERQPSRRERRERRTRHARVCVCEYEIQRAVGEYV